MDYSSQNLAIEKRRSAKRILKQHGDGHGADSARTWGDRTGDMLHFVEGYIAGQAIALARLQDRRVHSRFKPVSLAIDYEGDARSARAGLLDRSADHDIGEPIPIHVACAAHGEADIDAGKVSTVVVWRLDRLGRTASGLTALFDKLIARKVNLVSLKDGVDLSTAAGRLIANVLASVAAYENEVRSERIVAGQAAARAAGKRWGGSAKGRRVKVNQEQVRAIRRLHGEAVPVAGIARATGLSRPTVYSVINEAN